MILATIINIALGVIIASMGVFAWCGIADDLKLSDSTRKVGVLFIVCFVNWVVIGIGNILMG